MPYIERERLIDTYAVGLLTTSSVITVQFHFTRHCKSLSDILRLRRRRNAESGFGRQLQAGGSLPAAGGEGEGVLKTVMRIADWAERRGPSVLQQC